MFGSSQSRERLSDSSMWLADGSHTQSDAGVHTPQKSGLLSSIGSRLLRAVPWSSPRRSVLPTHDEPTPPKRAKIEEHLADTPKRAERMSYSSTTSTLPSPKHTPDRQALFARAATPSALRSRAQLTPARTHILPESETLPTSQSMGRLSMPRSSWSSLHLGPTQTPSLSTQPSVRAWLPKRSDILDEGTSASHLQSSVLGKREPPAEETNESDQPSARKRRMVWDPEMGFVDADDLEASRPRPPPPQNEAERILRALESMRTPLGDARREGIIRSQSMPSWHTASIPVPLPTPERASALRPSQARLSARNIAPHSRSLQRTAQLRRTQQSQQPSMRSKLRNSVQVDEMYSMLPDEQEVEQVLGDDDGAMREEELIVETEVPVRRTRRTKAKKSTKAVRTMDEPTVEEPEGALKPTPAVAEAPRVPPSAPEAPAAAPPAPPAASPQPSAAPSSKPAARRPDSFSVRSDDDPERKRSVLRQGSAKQTRKHAPSGRITAFDDDEEDDMPQAEELEKIKLPTGLFPSTFSFGEGASDTKPHAPPVPAPAETPSSSAPAGPSSAKPSTSNALLDRLSAPTDTSTTPSKPPAPGATLFAPKEQTSRFAAPQEPKPAEKPVSSFFAAPPSSTSSLSTTKNDGPVPNFFGKPASDPPKAGLGMASAFGAPPSKDGQPAETAKPSFSFGQSSGEKEKPTGFSFGKPNEDKEKPSGFSFGKPSEEKEKPSEFSFGKPSEEKEKPSEFSFGKPSEEKEKPSGFSFGKPSEEKEKPTGFSFGKPNEEKEKPSGVSFSKPSEEKDKASEDKQKSTGFSFGKPEGPKPSSGLGLAAGFGTSSGTAKPSGFSFGQSDASKPSFSFGSSAPKPADDKPAFSFGAKPVDKPAEPAAEKPAEKPVDQAAEPATEKPSEKRAEKPAFSIGASSDQPPASGVSFGAKPSGFSFGKPDASKAPDTPLFGTPPTTSEPKPDAGPSTAEAKPAPPFSFGQPKSDAHPKESKPAFSFGQPAAEDPEKKRTRDEEEPASKRPAPGLSATAPPFSFGKPTETPAPAAPFAGAFGKPQDKPADTQPQPFVFGKSAEAPKPAEGTFGASTEKPAEKPAFSFGKPADDKPAFSFGKPAAPTPSFSFGAQSTAPKPASPFSFGAAPSGSGPSSGPGSGHASPAPTTSFSFGQGDNKPAFSFGSGVNPPAPTTSFSFGQPAPSSGTPTFGGASGGAGNAPAPFTFGSGQPAAPTTSFSFTSNAPPSGGPAPFQFGSGTPPPAAPSGNFAFQAPNPAANPAPAPAPAQPFTFGAPPSAPGSPAPFSFGTPPPGDNNNNLFTMGASPAPTGRQIKPLRQPRRRN